MKVKDDNIKWLLSGDPSIQYQVEKDLLANNDKNLQAQIEKTGWGKQFLDKRKSNGHWGMKFYQPKWTSSHYTLLDLRNLCISPNQILIQQSIKKIIQFEVNIDGGINPAGSVNNSDVCINGMFLNYASYFQSEEGDLKTVIDFILSQKMPDGGFNCQLNRSGAVHSSMHTTISTLEGMTEYLNNAYSYRSDEIKTAIENAKEFLLQHHLFRSDKTGETIKESFLKMPYPPRWYYDYMRALDYFRYSKSDWDDRLMPAIDWLLCKKTKSNQWKISAKLPGKIHFEMEKAGKISRWNTLRALRILKYFKIDY